MFKYGYKVFLVYNKRIFHVETRLGHFTAWAQGLGIAAVAPYSIYYNRSEAERVLYENIV